MTRLFRPVDPPDAPTPPVGRVWRGLLAVEAWRFLAWAATLLRSRAARVVSVHALMLVGLVCQAVALLALGYMVDLSISLMELWADLAQKHMELTL